MSPENDELREEGIKALQTLQETKEVEETPEEEETDEVEGAEESSEGEEELNRELVEELKTLRQEVEEYKKREVEREAKVEEILEEAEEPDPEDAEAIRAAKKERVAQVLSRGVLNQKLQAIVDDGTPEDRVGKLVLDTEEKILQYQNLDFTFDYREGAKGLNKTSDGRIRVGDLVLMTISKDDHSILREVRTERVKEKLSAGRDEYKRLAAEAGETAGVSMDDSSTIVHTGTG